MPREINSCHSQKQVLPHGESNSGHGGESTNSWPLDHQGFGHFKNCLSVNLLSCRAKVNASWIQLFTKAVVPWPRVEPGPHKIFSQRLNQGITVRPPEISDSVPQMLFFTSLFTAQTIFLSLCCFYSTYSSCKIGHISSELADSLVYRLSQCTVEPGWIKTILFGSTELKASDVLAMNSSLSFLN